MSTDVKKRRVENAVDNVGIIETAFQQIPSRSVQSEFREGRASLEKCEVISSAVSSCGAEKNLGVHVNKKVLLHPLRVDIPAGSITAILGGAGCGMSTLLKFLAGHMDRGVDYDGRGELMRHCHPYISFDLSSISYEFTFMYMMC